VAKLYFYYSAMNAGKSTTLLQSDYNYRERGMKTLLFTPHIDNRQAAGKITSRIGISGDAEIYDQTFDFLHYVTYSLQQGRHIDCVLIDEAQFLSKAQVLQLTDICDKCSIPVLAYGIRTDFRGEPFEGSLYLLALAEELVEIKTVCHCGRKATMNSRLNEAGDVVFEGAQVDVGYHYVSTCRKHFKAGVVKPERSSRTTDKAVETIAPATKL